MLPKAQLLLRRSCPHTFRKWCSQIPESLFNFTGIRTLGVVNQIAVQVLSASALPTHIGLSPLDTEVFSSQQGCDVAAR